MVEGFDRFKAHFADYTDQYILIGGTACTVAMENVGLPFRATKDLDLVLCVEVLNANFATAFWQFVRDGQYETQETASGERQFYRFTKPQTAGYPFMLELFSRTLGVLTPAAGSVLTPILYLPGVRRQDLRAVSNCPEHLKPLADLQYRGVIWSQVNAKDWTIASFLQSSQGGLVLDIALDNEAKNAMRLALFRLLDERIDLLEGKHLDKDYFNKLLTGGDPVRDLLLWIDNPGTFRENCDVNTWNAFVAICKSQLKFDPDRDGELEVAERLAERAPPWDNVWQRFADAPKKYPNIPAQIREALDHTRPTSHRRRRSQ